MKKNVLGIIALTLAIGLSAFTNTKAHSAKTNPLYYWYDLNGNALNGGVAKEEPSTDCTTLGIGCARGFNSPTSHPKTDTPSATRMQNP